MLNLQLGFTPNLNLPLHLSHIIPNQSFQKDIVTFIISRIIPFQENTPIQTMLVISKTSCIFSSVRSSIKAQLKTQVFTVGVQNMNKSGDTEEKSQNHSHMQICTASENLFQISHNQALV